MRQAFYLLDDVEPKAVYYYFNGCYVYMSVRANKIIAIAFVPDTTGDNHIDLHM